MRINFYLIAVVLVIGAAIVIFGSKPSRPSTDNGAVEVILQTSKGEIRLKLDRAIAPKTTANFIAKAKEGFYNNLTFHRVEDWVVQGGDPKGDGTGGGNQPTELSKVPFIRGSLGVARGPDINISNNSQFFILKTDAPWLNNQYTNFGEVISGIEIIDALEIGDKIISISIADN